VRLLEGLGSSDPGFSLEPQYGPCDPTELQQVREGEGSECGCVRRVGGAGSSIGYGFSFT
jgi:hypothetical protein